MINAALRRKEFREAADSGLLLWRQNFSAILPFFAIPFMICAFAFRLFPENWKYLSWLILWLLKPLFDRVVLHIISVRFFDKGANMKRLMQGLGKTIFRGLTGDLLWRRFSPMRAVIMPVRVLERNIKSAKGIKARKKLLENGGIGYCFLLTIWGIAVEAALLAGQIIFFITMAELITGSFASYTGNFAEMEIYIYAAWCINYILVETIYVCLGFCLYINGRIAAEGWDIEITFRNIAEKQKNKMKIAALIIFSSICLFMPVKTEASDAPLETLQTILESPDFGGTKDSWGIRQKNPSQPRDIPEFNSEFMQRLQQIFAYTLRFFLLVVIASLFVYLFIYLMKYRQNKTGKAESVSVKTLNASAAEDPNLLLEKAIRFQKNGETRLAWGYCTSAAIHSWPYYRGIVFPPDATENDCADIVRTKNAADAKAPADSILADEFCRLIKHWIYFAYAGQLPPQGSFEEAIALCKSLRKENG